MVGMITRKKNILMNEPHLVSASGHVLNVRSTEYAPMKSCTVSIEPLHPWGGDTNQTNGHSVSGWDTAKLYFSKRNIVPVDAVMLSGNLFRETGLIGSDSRYKCCPQFIPVEPDTVYTVQCNKPSSDSSAFTVPFYDSAKGLISRAVAYASTTETGLLTGQFTTPSNAAFIHFSVGVGNTDIQIEKGNTATAYESPIAVSIGLGQTVYGGTLNILTGVLTVDRVSKVIDGSIGLIQIGNITNRYFYADGLEPYGGIVDDDVISDIYADQPGISTSNKIIGIRMWNRSASGAVRFLVRPEGFADYTAETYNAYLADHPFTIVYRLTTPRTYTIDPQIVKSPRGCRIITTNVGGSLSASVWTH